jgi:hypothetical protein
VTDQPPGERKPGDHEADSSDDGSTQDPGAYIGRLPERATETIPGGLGPKDVRVAAVATQPGPVRGEDPADVGRSSPGGHREAKSGTDDGAREAGQDQ